MMQETASNENRVLAALGYPIGVVAIFVLLTDLKQSSFMRRHAVQAIVWLVAGVALFVVLSLVLAAVVSIFPFLLRPLTLVTPIVGFVWGAMTVWYGYRAYQGQMFTIPLLSTYTARYLF